MMTLIKVAILTGNRAQLQLLFFAYLSVIRSTKLRAVHIFNLMFVTLEYSSAIALGKRDEEIISTFSAINFTRQMEGSRCSRPKFYPPPPPPDPESKNKK